MRETRDPMSYIRARLPESVRLDMAAEEAVELAHALLKLKRTLPDSLNPTPVDYGDAVCKVIEEYADLMVALDSLFPELDGRAHSVYLEKLLRWLDRLREAEKKPEPQQGEHCESCLDCVPDCLCLSCRHDREVDSDGYGCCDEHGGLCGELRSCPDYAPEEPVKPKKGEHAAVCVEESSDYCPCLSCRHDSKGCCVNHQKLCWQDCPDYEEEE